MKSKAFRLHKAEFKLGQRLRLFGDRMTVHEITVCTQKLVQITVWVDMLIENPQHEEFLFQRNNNA